MRTVRVLTIGVGVAAVVLLVLSGKLIHLLTESWWFESVGFASVFQTQLSWKVGAWIVGAVVSASVVLVNYAWAMWLTRDRLFQFLADNLEWGEYVHIFPNLLAGVLSIVLALMGGASASTNWDVVLKSINAANYDTIDPIFQRDLGFYLFQLPLFTVLQEDLLGLVAIAIAIAATIYILKGEVSLDRGWSQSISGGPKVHLGLLIALLALILGWGIWLQRYELLYSPTGVVFGAGYTDINARLPVDNVMTVGAVIVASTWLMSLWQRNISLPVTVSIVALVSWLGLAGAYPMLMQKLVVEPNEITKEQEYITNNIEFTRAAYGLSQAERRDFEIEATLDRQILAENTETIENIRLWDYEPLLSTYRQLQEIRLYYRFPDADIDRYTINDRYRQVILAPRELSYSQVPDQAKTWVNQHLKYTHGYGVVMSPVNRVTPDGLPEFFIKDIPPESSTDLKVKESRIYYGEETNTYIFTGTTTQEFDYPKGSENALTTYSGLGGVPMGSIGRRLVYALKYGSIQLPTSNYFTANSRIHYHRQIRDRVQTVAPFLRLDSDPYVVIDENGRLKWIVDAYTTSNRYPYSRPVNLSDNASTILDRRNLATVVRNNVNYMRNSVKVIVDAYNGTMEFIAMDDSDPVLATYRNIYPNLFSERDTVSANLVSHFRYPIDLFDVQAHMYLAYHMESPSVFYNREDLWRFPVSKQTAAGDPSRSSAVEPFYTIVSLPGEEGTEFVTILPLTPVNKDNTIAWIAARSDGENYGRLLVYNFPKQSLVYGPSQIEARIDQNPVISQQLTLWSQKGSNVLRGNLLVIPLSNSLLYIQPVYLRADQGELPELKRVVVAYENEIVMEPTLDLALAAIFGESDSLIEQTNPEDPIATDNPSPKNPDSDPTTPIASPLARRALTLYREAEAALQTGDWATYGEKQTELEAALQRLSNGETSISE
jgi:uncharacterized membrane protein (UPF0182 family)